MIIIIVVVAVRHVCGLGLETYNEISVRITVNKIYIQVVLLLLLSMLNITKKLRFFNVFHSRII